MTKDLRQVLRFKCPDCGATLQGEVDESGDFIVSVYEKGEKKPDDQPTRKTKGAILDFLFAPPGKREDDDK